MSADLALGLSEVIGGHDRDVGAARQSGEYKQNDGREHILFGEYVTLATHAIFTAAVAMHTLLVICWNLTSRMDSAIHVIYLCIFWSCDHINIQLPVTKAGQAYSKQGAEENMLCCYANPTNHYICLFVAIGVHIMVLTTYSNKLFPKSDMHGTFNAWMQAGIDRNNVGTHSVRKGSLSFALTAAGRLGHRRRAPSLHPQASGS